MTDPIRHNLRNSRFHELNVEGFRYLVPEGEHPKATFEHDLALTPENPILLNNLGNALAAMNKFDEAIDAYKRAIDANPLYPKPFANLAILHQLAGHGEAAMHLYERYLTLAPDDGEAHHNLGLLYMDAGRNVEAANAFAAAAQHLEPDTAERATNLGVGAFFRGDLDTAFSLFEKALSVDASFVPARYHLGVTHLCQGRCTEAIEALEAVLEATPDYPQAAVNLAVAYNSDGRADKAIALLEALKKKQPDDPGVVLNLGFAYQEADQIEDAVASFRRVISMSTAKVNHVEKARRALEKLGAGYAQPAR